MKLINIITFSLIFLALNINQSLAKSFNIDGIKWSKLSSLQQKKLIHDYKEFLESYERNGQNNIANSRYSAIEKYFTNLINAYANEGYNCIYGGWPSHRNSQGKCKWPQQNNSKYNDYKNSCTGNQLLCNPMLFGDNICIDFSTLEKRKQAYSQCQRKFNESSRDLDQIVNNINENDFNELTEVIDDICNKPNISTQAVTPMCSALKNKMSKYVPNTFPAGIDYGKNDKLGVRGKLDLLQNLTDEFDSDLHKFAKDCGERFPKSKEIECQNLLGKLQQSEKNIETIKAELESTMGTEAFCKAYSETFEVSQNFFVAEEVAEQVTCTEQEKASYKKSCLKDVMCFGASSVVGVAAMAIEAIGVDTGDCIQGENSCAVQAITALVDALWISIKGTWDLLKMGYNAASDWVSDKWNSFWEDTEEIENKSSDAQAMLSNLSEADKDQIENDKEGWLKKTLKNIWGGIKHWISHDIYCQQWSGAPRYSTCEKPFSFSCMKCDSLLKGTCALIGAVSSEIVKAYFTGGASIMISRGASAAGVALKGSKALSAAVNGASSLIKIPATAAAKAGKWIVKSKVVSRASSFTTKRLASKGAGINAKLTSLKGSLAYKAFKNAASGTYKYTGVKSFVKANKKSFVLGQKHASKLVSKKVTGSTNSVVRTGQINSTIQPNAPPKIVDDIVDVEIVSYDKSGIPIYDVPASKTTPAVIAPKQKQLASFNTPAKYQDKSVFIDATNEAQKSSLQKFSKSVDMDDTIVELMDAAHRAPDGFAKNRQIKLLIDEVASRPGMTKVKAQDLILGVKNSKGIRTGGLASDDVMVLGFRDKIKKIFKREDNLAKKPLEQTKQKAKADAELKAKLKLIEREKLKAQENKILAQQNQAKKNTEFKKKEQQELRRKKQQEIEKEKHKVIDAQKAEYETSKSNFDNHLKSKNSTEEVQKYSSPKEIEKQYQLNKLNKELKNKEVEINFKSLESARYFSQNHPILLKYKFGTPRAGPGSGWTPFKSRMSKSKFNGKYVGFEKKLEDGTYARYRLDWDPDKGAHYNIELSVIDEMGRPQNIKFATKFDCNGVPCTENQINKHVNRMQNISDK